MRVLVTGATGFLGHRFAERLLARGEEYGVSSLRVTGRNGAAAKDLEAAGAELVIGDVTDPVFAERIVRDVDAVMHCAGRNGIGGGIALYQGNIDSTHALVVGARAAEVRRFVHIGTPSMYFDRTNRLDRDESYRPRTIPDGYSESKLAADRIVLAANGPDFTTISLRPRFTTGRGEVGLLGRFIGLHRSGALKRIGRGQNIVDFTAVANQVDAMVLALTAPPEACGEAYNITNGEPVKLWSLLDEVMVAVGLGRIATAVPYRVAALGGAVVESVSALRGVPPTLSRLSAAVLSHSMTMSIDKARSRLGYLPRQTNAEMIAEFTGWYVTEGYGTLDPAARP